MAAGPSVDAAGWVEEFEAAFARIAGRFGRVEPRRRARSFLLGLLGDVESRSCWQLAEHAGERSPRGMQRLLGEAVWDADGVRDDLRGYVAERLGAADGVLVIDDTGDLKKGTRSVGVQRQYTGTAGRVENAQVGVFLAYASSAGHALVDREIYLPRPWADDPQRCAAAGVPDGVGFATKITLARRMLTRAHTAGMPARWVTADEFYGNDRHLRADLHARSNSYVLAVARNHRVIACMPIGPQSAEQLAAALPSASWNRRSCGQGAKGPREYDWAWIRLAEPGGGHHWLLVRRRIRDGELAFYRCWSPQHVPLRTLVRVAGIRWSIETCFQATKRLGLDQHQVRRWNSWYRHTTLVMLAHAILTAIAAAQPTDQPGSEPALIPLTINEIRRLLAKLITTTAHTLKHWMGWSVWRRRHQARARTSHYRRRGHPEHPPTSTQRPVSEYQRDL